MAKKKAESIFTIEMITAELEIAEVQIERIRVISRERLLSFEEAKIYDILNKNLQLIKDKRPSIPADSKRVLEDKTEFSNDVLMEMAKTKEAELALQFADSSLDYIQPNVKEEDKDN